MQTGIMITLALKVLGSSCAQIARDCGVSRALVSGVLAGRSRSEKVERAVALALQSKCHELWPDWYDVKDRRKPNSMRNLLSLEQRRTEMKKILNLASAA